MRFAPLHLLLLFLLLLLLLLLTHAHQTTLPFFSLDKPISKSENAKLEYKCAFFFHFLSLFRFAKYTQCFLSHFGCVCLCVCVFVGYYCCYCNLQLLNVARLVANDFIVLH